MPTRRQQQQTCQNQCPNATCASTRLKRSRTTVRATHCTQARKTLRCHLGQCWRQLFSHAEHSAHHLHAHSNSKHAKISDQTPTCASTRLKRPHATSNPSASCPHTPLVDATSATAGGSFSARPGTQHITCTHTAAEKQHHSVSVDTNREKGVEMKMVPRGTTPQQTATNRRSTRPILIMPDAVPPTVPAADHVHEV